MFWFEEPFEPESLDQFSSIRRDVNVRLAAGENEFGLQGFQEHVRAQTLDILQPDACRCGGISEVKRVADLAGKAGLEIATHSWSDAAAIMANAHVVAAVPHGLTVEVDRTGNPFVDDLLVEPLPVCDGMLALGSAPGLGIELNESVLETYRLEDPLHPADGSYSDMVFGPQFDTPAGPYA